MARKKQTDFHRHLARGIPNTKENRQKITDLNKLMAQSDSSSRLLKKYRKPRNGVKSAGVGAGHYYRDGSVRKADGTMFSVYLKNSDGYNEQLSDIRYSAYMRYRELSNKYDRLVAKVNAPALNKIIEQLQDDVNDLGHQPVTAENWKELARSLASLGVHIGIDLKELEKED